MSRALARLVVIAGIVAVAAAGTPACAQQQQQDVRDLIDRVDRLERDLNILQSQFYRSQAGSNAGSTQSGTTVINSPASHLSNDAYSQLDQRISTLEDQMRTLTGEIEKAGHDTTELGARLDRMQADNDVRFKEIEQKVGVGGPAAANAPATPPSGAAPGSGQGAPAGQASAGAGGQWNPTMGSAPHPLGQMSENDLHKLEPKNSDAGTQPAAATQPVYKTPQEQYDAAFALLRNNDSAGATKAFKSFVAQHPKDPLAGNATFWIGQIAFSQGKFQEAAPLFFEAYSKYPKSAKAGESLLKVGLSMSNLGKKREACAALVRFTTEFPDASEGLKRQAVAEKQKLGCG